MQAALPVVATDIPGNDELVVDGETGFLIPVGDTKAIASRATQLLDQEPLRLRLGQAGRRRIEQHFSVDEMVNGHIRLYRELVRKKGLGARG